MELFDDLLENPLEAKPSKILLAIFAPMLLYGLFSLTYFVHSKLFYLWASPFLKICAMPCMAVSIAWHYLVGFKLVDTIANQRNPNSQKGRVFMLRNYLAFAGFMLLFVIGLYFLLFNPGMLTGGASLSETFLNNLFVVIFVVWFMNAYLNASFIAKYLAKVINPRRRLTYLFCAWIFPIGVWFLYPKMRRIKVKKDHSRQRGRRDDD